MLREFRAFILRGNLVDLAVAVVIGTSFTAVVNALGSARPMSSLAKITSRRAMKRGSSPASIILAR